MDQEELITCIQTVLREFISGAMMGLATVIMLHPTDKSLSLEY